MYLVDTSIWIATFRQHKPLDLAATIDMDEVVTCLPVVQEVLQGFRDDAAFRKARVAMLNLPIVDSPLEQAVFEDAANLYRIARRKGVTVRSSVDCLIAASAIRHGLTVLHRDRDYAAIAKISALEEQSA